MPTRDHIAAATARSLAAADLPSVNVVLGLDGFIDEIIDVVDKRHTPDRYDRMATISQFGDRIHASAGASANFELVVQRRKLGGQGPIMANALATLGTTTTYLGAVADPANPHAIDPIFADFARHATLIPLTPPARTLALEFSDGKLMLGTLTPLTDLTWDRITTTVGPDRLATLIHNASLLGMLNWTMIPHLTAIWQNLTELLARRPPPPAASPRPHVFIDLADPGKREPADLRNAMLILSSMNHHADVTLGLNISEASQVLTALGVPLPASPEQAVLATTAATLRQTLVLDTVVIHPRTGAAAATASSTASFAGPFIRQPAISTGGGDHFNAGFALGQTLNLPLEQSLCLGVATSGYYVRHAASPTRTELTTFLQNLPAPE